MAAMAVTGEPIFPIVQKLGLTSKKTVHSFDEVQGLQYGIPQLIVPEKYLKDDLMPDPSVITELRLYYPRRSSRHRKYEVKQMPPYIIRQSKIMRKRLAEN